ncbi:MAG: hypothetical protein Q9216_000572 [Gyalolechia sp. 2 TL-2023]
MSRSLALLPRQAPVLAFKAYYDDNYSRSEQHNIADEEGLLKTCNMSAAANRMAAKVAESATKAMGKAAQSGSSGSGGPKKGQQHILQKGAKKDPELYILLTIMTGAFGLAGYHFGRKPTSSSAEAPVSMAEGTMPWQTSSQKGGKDEHFKYQYHPGGDPSKAPKKAPSALNTVIIPNVTLRKSVHDQVNKWGKDEYDF